MKLTPAEDWSKLIDECLWTQLEHSDKDSITHKIRQIQADALRFAAELVLKGHFQEVTSADLDEIANQLHPLPDAKPVSKCCHANLIVDSSDEGTSSYQCSRCYKPTDAVLNNP